MADDRSYFVRHRRHRPWRISPSVAALALEGPAALRLPPPQQRPARFVAGLDILDAHETLVPKDACQSAPLDIAIYEGRAEEVDDEGQVTARVWELPGGQESIATISPEQLEGEAVRPGAALRIWTWLELPDGPVRPEPGTEPAPRIHIDVRHRELTQGERTEVEHLVAALTKAREEEPG